MQNADTNSESPIIVWFRNDLRLSDNPALTAAIQTRQPVLAVYIHDTKIAGKWRPGGASSWWLHHSLMALNTEFSRLGGRLHILSGDAKTELEKLIDRVKANSIVWNRRYEPYAISQDSGIKQDLKSKGIKVQSFKANLLFEPWDLATKTGKPYRVFTPFWKAIQSRSDINAALPKPSKIHFANSSLDHSITDLNLLPTQPDWSGGLQEYWDVGETAANRGLTQFLDTAIEGYKENRNRPDQSGTSRLSAHLHFGEISPRQIWLAVSAQFEPGHVDAHHFLSELVWREFSYHLLYHFPELPSDNFQSRFDRFDWQEDEDSLEKWSKGRTGYPIVDAGMRELWHTGWMHNRVRMIVASFLIKHLMVDWRKGQDWFWDTLVDADLASNAASWQWVAGSGADAAPYFRIFNPILQGERFDPEGVYIRKWLPQLSNLDNNCIHKPWTATTPNRGEVKFVLGQTYPAPIIDHAEARQRALKAFARIKEAA